MDQKHQPKSSLSQFTSTIKLNSSNRAGFYERGQQHHIATQWTCDDITLSSLLFIHHSSKRSKRHNNTSKERRRTNNLPNNKKIGFSKLDIGSKEGNKPSDDKCTSRRKNKRDQMTANKIAQANKITTPTGKKQERCSFKNC